MPYNTNPGERSRRPLTVADVESRMKDFDKERATRYMIRCETNPDTHPETSAAIREYRMQNPDKFLTDSEIESRGGRRAFIRPRDPQRFGYTGGYQDMSKGRIHPGNGYTYDAYGNTYRDSNYGFREGGYADQGFRGAGQMRYEDNSQYRAMVDYRREPRVKKDPRVAYSIDEMYQTLAGLSSNVNRSKYIRRASENPDTNPITMNNLMEIRRQHPEMFATQEEIEADRALRANSWEENRVPRNVFEKFSAFKKNVISRLYNTRDRDRNVKYLSRIVFNPHTTEENRKEALEIGRDYPKLLFTKDWSEGFRPKPFDDKGNLQTPETYILAENPDNTVVAEPVVEPAPKKKTTRKKKVSE